MSARNTLLGIAVLLALLTASILFLMEHGGADLVDAASDEVALSEGEEIGLAAPDAASSFDGELADAEDSMRISVGDQADASQVDPTEQFDVHGVVLDENGDPAAGVKVAIRAHSIGGHGLILPPVVLSSSVAELSGSEHLDPATSPGPSSIQNFRSNPSIAIQGSIRIPDLYPPQFTTRSDSFGAFRFESVFGAPLHRLYFGHDLFLGVSISQDVTRDGRAQVLRLPQRPSSGLAITLTTEGHPLLDPEWLLPEPLVLAEEVERGYRRVNPWDVQLFPGKALIHGLAPGRWSVVLRCRGGQFLRREFYVLDQLGLTEVQIRVTETELRSTTSTPAGVFHFNADNTDVKLNASNHLGELDLKNKTPREFGEAGSDKYFGHSLSGFGSGQVTAAFLVLDLEGDGNSCSNDSISLGYAGAQNGMAWKWSRRINALPDGQGWGFGVRRTVTLNLGQLPGATWGANDMLAYMTDGELDVFIEDDTIVHSINLRVYR
jgi:hypothetical protein